MRRFGAAISVTALTSLLVKPSTTTTALTFTTPVKVGSEGAANFKVTVTSATGAIPVGTVTVKVGTQVACSATLNSAGVGACTLSPSKLGAKAWPIKASYAGSGAFTASTSAQVTLTVTP